VPETDVKTAPLTLVTMFDVHADWYQKDGGALTENVIVYGNTAIGCECQNIFLADTTAINDLVFINNAIHNKAANGSAGILKSQCSRSHSHVIIAHNSFASQDLLLRTPTYNPDAYCLVANNAVKALAWEGVVDADLTIVNNHIHAGQLPPPGAAGTTSGGTGASLFADAENGDFAPAGDLLANGKVPVVQLDIAGATRPALASVGAKF
jgi:hypothetical protein